MSANFLVRLGAKKSPADGKRSLRHWLIAVALVAWTLLGFGAAQLVAVGVLVGLGWVGVPVAEWNQTILTTVMAAVIYLLTLTLLISIPWLAGKHRTSRSDMGLTRPMSWGDIGLAPLAFLVYIIVSSLLIYATGVLFPNIDLTQTQEIGFGNISRYYQYLLVFITLVVVAPVAEEMIFRGYLYGKLRKIMPLWLVMLVVSVIFAVIHGQWNVAIDVFALSILLCVLREITGSIWAGILLHMIKNGIAFFILFIYPMLSHTIGG